MENKYASIVKSPIGDIIIIANETAVNEITFGNRKIEDLTENKHSIQAAKELAAYFEGSLKEFSFPIQQNGTDFQQEVWQNLLKIPYGETTSYAKFSAHKPLAIRAIAAANGKKEVVELLLAKGANPNIEDRSRMDAVSWAYFNKRTDIINLFEERNILSTTTKESLKSRLNRAIEHRDFKEMQEVLSYKGLNLRALYNENEINNLSKNISALSDDNSSEELNLMKEHFFSLISKNSYNVTRPNRSLLNGKIEQSKDLEFYEGFPSSKLKTKIERMRKSMEEKTPAAAKDDMGLTSPTRNVGQSQKGQGESKNGLG